MTSAEPLEIIRRNSERLLTLVSDLLSSRNGQLIVTPHAVDVAELVRASGPAALPEADASRVVLKADTPARLDAHVDGPRISQVLDNLVSNAIKYSPDGGNVVVSLEQEDGHAGLQGQRHRDGHERRGPGRGLRQVLPHQQRAQDRHPRRGPGAAHQQGHRGSPRRDH